MDKHPDMINAVAHPSELDATQALAATDAESIERVQHREATRTYVERVDRYLARPDLPR